VVGSTKDLKPASLILPSRIGQTPLKLDGAIAESHDDGRDLPRTTTPADILRTSLKPVRLVLNYTDHARQPRAVVYAQRVV
jgi:hypothetical protein